MINVDVFLPALEKTYDFNVDENTTTALIIEEIAVMICQKERYPDVKDSGQLLLCCIDSKKNIRPDPTLNENGIVTGSRLMLL